MGEGKNYSSYCFLCPILVKYLMRTKYLRRPAMINKIDFSEKNLTSNSGAIMLYSHTDDEGIFEMIDEEVNFHNPSINKIK